MHSKLILKGDRCGDAYYKFIMNQSGEPLFSLSYTFLPGHSRPCTTFHEVVVAFNLITWFTANQARTRLTAQLLLLRAQLLLLLPGQLA